LILRGRCARCDLLLEARTGLFASVVKSVNSL
jgi:hypothetical protein